MWVPKRKEQEVGEAYTPDLFLVTFGFYFVFVLLEVFYRDPTSIIENIILTTSLITTDYFKFNCM